MGNCSLKGIQTKTPDPIRIMTDSGQILEFDYPKLASEVLNDFPGHGIFAKGHLSSPLRHHEQLLRGRFYYLFPLAPDEQDQSTNENAEGLNEAEPARKPANEVPLGLSEAESVTMPIVEPLGAIEPEPVRISTSAMALGIVTKNLTDGSGFEVLPPPRKGVWKVKLVIDTKQLEEILSEEVNTEALIEQMRAAAASSTKAAMPRQSKGYRGVHLKPICCNVFNNMLFHDDHQSSDDAAEVCSPRA